MAREEGRAGNGGEGPGSAAFRVQNQIRRNAQDMQEYLTELGSWEKSIKKKDKQLSRKATAASPGSHQRGTPNAAATPVRLAGVTVPVSSGPTAQPSQSNINPVENNSGDANAMGAGNEQRGASNSGQSKPFVSAAGHTYDKGYDKWAKFDIDAALRSIDKEGAGLDEKRPTGSDSDTDGDDVQQAIRLTPATMVDRSFSQDSRRRSSSARVAAPPPEIPSKETSRNVEKEERGRGNAKFGQGDFEGAVKSYTRCVVMNSKSSLAFSNRAMAYLKLKEFGKAEADADAALRLDPRHVKSLQRRAAARNALGKHRAALGDLQIAVELDPTSKQVRKDLSKTLETLKTAVRRAPKRQVKVESAPMPAPKPRGSSPQRKSQTEGPRAAFPDRPARAVVNAVGAISATDPHASLTGLNETAAPFSSVLCESADQRFTDESNVYSYPARTMVEELPDDAEVDLPASSRTIAETVNATTAERVMPPASITVASDEDRAFDTEGIASSSGTMDQGGVAPNAGLLTPEPVAETSAMASSIANVEANPDPPTVSVVAESEQDTFGGDEANDAGGARGGNKGIDCQEASGIVPSLQDKGEGKEASAPIRTSQTSGVSGAARVSTAQTMQLPTTGYQFEHMWRSTDGSTAARLELLRTVPPSLVSKFFRRTPIEIDLLSGILLCLEEAFLPKRPATALRWLKSLSKACRFDMTAALLGEAEGRAAARRVLARLEGMTSAKVDPREVEVLKNKF